MVLAAPVEGTDDPAATRRRRKSRESGAEVGKAGPLVYIMLALGAALSVFPLYFMFVVATRTNDTIGSLPPVLTPGGQLGDNVQRLLDNEDAHFLRGLLNSVLVSASVTIAVVLFSTLAGFAFAKLRFRGRNALLLVIVATMAIPVQLGLIPLYILMVELGWVGELKAVIVPFLVSGFGVFMMRQYAASAVSDELIEAAKVDGCSTLRIYWNVVLPAVRPAAAVLGLFTFMQTWNDFLWPYSVLNQDQPTVQLSLATLSSGYYSDFSQIFAGTALATLPLLMVFLLFGRQIIGGIMEGALKA
ncbi:MAG: ABC transporter, permease protein 2 (cluster 1, maltose/g3p/polyamine/iron) [uncultured Corynebacteriales bacterium]|uniref:ABC transporter, permease protein 2 (Cluster 1, maltose/g3p/polyamine/iron) n=1 Tax=uncultured Mycobacteriales bacterium TaxID=581187 RepID=A0A6J4K226_9ACTN|nr:MAG: ABC transporter, permease protein 2 (cluster 1, maltose/g3p/polyamine/iron) [uncultured Corynebacteriales bacterium]